MSLFQNLVRRLLPARVGDSLKRAYISSRENRIAWSTNRYDRRHFARFRFRSVQSATLDQLEGKLTFHAHSLEKGLSHADMKPQFGLTALRLLAATMEAYTRQGFPLERRAYVNALSTLRAYMDTHTEHGFSTEHLSSILGEDLVRDAQRCQSQIGGVDVITPLRKANSKDRNFADLFRDRASVREFDSRGVRAERILPALELVLKTPSVCNRQATHATIVTDVGLIERILTLQGGMTGYKNPPALLAVSANISAFLAPTERNQAFVDGGLYAMSLLLALEYEGLAACPLNAMMTPAVEDSLRRLLRLPPSHRLIVFIAVGEFPGEVKVPRSFRYSLEDLVRVL